MSTRWAIAGPGQIAAIIAQEFHHVPDAELVAVGSRSAERARAFADRFEIPQSFGDYAELFASDVDAIYLATPHGQHTELALAAIEAGKAVLVEKSFTTSVADTASIIDAARARGVFVMEAMRTRFLPAVARLRELVDADPSLVHARGGDGKTPLHCARTVEIAQYLIDRGADLDARDVDHESTPAQYLVREAPDVARLLVDLA